MRAGYVRIEDLRVHHVFGGRGTPPVLLIHGLGSAGYLEWRFTLPALAERYRVFAPDLPGFGRSDRPPDGYGIPLFSRVVEEYVRRRRIKPVLVGASMGGRVALEVALRRPETVEKLVLVNSLGVVRPNVQPFYPLMLVPGVGERVLGLVREGLHRVPPHRVRSLASRFLGVRGDPERVLDDAHLARLREMYGAPGFPRAYVATVRSLATPDAYRSETLLAHLAATGLPVQMIWGARDGMLPVDRARRACAAVPGARLDVIDDAGHAPQAERPEEFVRLLEQFIAA